MYPKWNGWIYINVTCNITLKHIGSNKVFTRIGILTPSNYFTE